MGASQSNGQVVFRSETPVQFAPDVVEQLSERQASPTPTPERQSTLDEHIRARIQNEVKQLRKAEEQVQEEIRLALEKENLDKEKAMAGEASGEAEAGAGSIKSSAVLLGDLEEIQAKIDRFQTRKSLANYPELKASQDALISCYKSHMNSSLECWKEVANFKNSVSQLEKEYFKTLQ
ncbi:hypothetical protein GYMLUDRAFT_222209 [Collybiopsis luxurians FD-317 M1]|uniref:MICOS complex subunit MIC19 n=1 Tax=Collybiopsis luxurians FD-317 M1 TaxID=944289 RepID=A0A0D0BIC1_9AGAR|nr:hypothetical protein GYMLUDRAFT_222209 [Collybiopsis luxurians FD-317 M1]